MAFEVPESLRSALMPRASDFFSERDVNAEEAYLLAQCLSEATVEKVEARLQPFETLSEIEGFSGASKLEGRARVFAGEGAVLNGLEISGKGDVFVFIGSGAVINRCTVQSIAKKTVIAIGFGATCTANKFASLKEMAAIVIGPGTTSGAGGSYLGEEDGSIVIGANCMISTQIAVRSGDSHGIYDLDTRKRVNKGKSVVLEEHCWIGRVVSINKGARIGRDTVVGQGSVVSGRLHKNCVYAGNPAKLVRFNTNWDRGVRDEIPVGFDWTGSGGAAYKKYLKEGFAGPTDTRSWNVFVAKEPYRSFDRMLDCVMPQSDRS